MLNPHSLSILTVSIIHIIFANNLTANARDNISHINIHGYKLSIQPSLTFRRLSNL